MEIGESPNQPCHFWVFIGKNWKQDLRNSHIPMLTAASLTSQEAEAAGMPIDKLID